MRAGAWAVVLSAACLTGYAQSDVPASAPENLQQEYDAAQRYQSKHDLADAAIQYRLFLANALGEVAVGRVAAGEYERAANHFDEALKLEPDSPVLELEYAGAALQSGSVEHARLLASRVLQTTGLDPKAAADAHALLGRALLKAGNSEKGKQELEIAVELDPTFEHGYELAVADLNMGDAKGAAKIFSEMETSFGNSAELHLKFGQAYLGSDFQADAVGEFQKAIAMNGRWPGVHYALAAAYLATAGGSKLEQAQQELRKEIAVSPKDAAAYAALGHLLAGQHHDGAQDTEAERDLKRATVLDPRSPDGFFYLGQFYADKKNLPEAEAALRQSISLTKDVSRNAYQVQKAHYLLGRLLMQSGQVDEGKQQIAESQALMQQSLKHAQNEMTDYLQQNHGGTADRSELTIAPAQKAADPNAGADAEALEKQLGPAIADSYNNLGVITAREGNSRGSVPYFEQAAEWNPKLPGLDVNLGRAAFAAGDYADAVGPLGRYVATHPAEEGARATLGLSQFMVKDFAAARKTLEPLSAKAGAGLQLKYAYAKSLIETGGVGEGVNQMVALEKANPNVADIHRTLGEAYAAKKAPEATEELQTAIRLKPRDGEAYAALGRLQLAQGDTKAGIASLETAAQLEPANSGLQSELAEAKAKLGSR
jgi:tetratricopeptide (TPR) repeat protein